LPIRIPATAGPNILAKLKIEELRDIAFIRAFSPTS